MITDERTEAERRRDFTDYGMCTNCGGSPMSQMRTDPNGGYVFEIICPACMDNPSGSEVLQPRPLGLS